MLFVYPRIRCHCTHLKQFLLRREAIALYRDALRAAKVLQDTGAKREMKDWIRGEFDRWKHNTDEVSLGRGSNNTLHPFSVTKPVFILPAFPLSDIFLVSISEYVCCVAVSSVGGRFVRRKNTWGTQSSKF